MSPLMLLLLPVIATANPPASRDTVILRTEYEKAGDTAGTIPGFRSLVSIDPPLSVSSNGTITYSAPFADAFDRIDTLTATVVIATGDTLRVRVIDGFDHLKAGWKGKILGKDGQTESLGDRTAYNNLWGRGTAVPDKDFRIAILASDSFPEESRLIWDTPSKASAYNGASVWCYTNFLWGNRQGIRESATGFPFRIDSLESLTLDFDYTPIFGDNQFKVALNGFLFDEPTLAPHSARDGDFFMIFDQIGKWIPPYPDTIAADTSIAGKPFLLLAKDSSNGYQWRRVIIRPDNELTRGSIDLLGLMHRFAEAGKLKTSQSIPNLQFGVEVTSGFGAIAIHHLAIDKRMKSPAVGVASKSTEGRAGRSGSLLRRGTGALEAFGPDGRRVSFQNSSRGSAAFPVERNRVLVGRIAEQGKAVKFSFLPKGKTHEP
ncbi:MAG: hypothetical protein H6686_03870 [Fibrobacteria bacterium]|nr:hypothetical protein [Fibrobacteria bacterium]